MKLRKLILIILGLALVFSLTACGEKATIGINDDGLLTEIEVTIPRTVSKILADAGIEVGENDEVNPSLDTKLTEVQEISISREHEITLEANGSKQTVTLVGGTVEDLLKKAGIELSENQKTDVELNEPLKTGMEVRIIDLTGIVVIADGETKSVFVEGPTVNEALIEAGVTLNDDDIVVPEKTESITEDMEIVVERIEFETVTETVAVDYEIEYQYDNSKAKGTETTTVSGENGEKEVTYKIKYLDGEEQEREVIEEKIIKEPVNAVVVVGTYVAPASSSGSSGSSSSGSSGGRTIVSKTPFYDCDGSGHGYYEIVYSDGSTEYEEF